MQATATLTQPIRGLVNQTHVTLVRDDLTAMEVDAVVFYAKETPELSSGFGTAIQTRGGDAVRKELEKSGGVRMGDAVITGAGRLKARHIIHACGPKFQEADTERKLRDCVLAALRLEGMRGGVYIAKAGLRGNDQQDIRTGCEMVERNLGRLSAMIMDMLYCAKDRSPRHLAVSIPAIAGEVLQMYSARAGELGVRLDAEISDGAGWIHGEARRSGRDAAAGEETPWW